MAKRKYSWVRVLPKDPNPTAPAAFKAEVLAKASDFVATVLKPKYVEPPPKNPTSNYVTDIGCKWHGRFFYLFATFACPGPNAISPFFESKFARFEYLGEGKFSVAFFRHTEEWFTIFSDLTIERCLETVRDDPWFIP